MLCTCIICLLLVYCFGFSFHYIFFSHFRFGILFYFQIVSSVICIALCVCVCYKSYLEFKTFINAEFCKLNENCIADLIVDYIFSLVSLPPSLSISILILIWSHCRYSLVTNLLTESNMQSINSAVFYLCCLIFVLLFERKKKRNIWKKWRN